MEELIVPVILIVIAIFNAVYKAAKKADGQARPMQPNPWAQRQHAPAPQAAPAPPVTDPAPPHVAPAAAQVHVHLQPDCETHDAPSGSLGFVSSEGKDPCHEEQLTHPRAPQEAAKASPGLSLDFSPNALVQAFVMHEVLTRPGQKRR